MHQVLDLIHGLRTTHGTFIDEPLPPGTLDLILQAAIRAPNAGNAQNYAVIVVEDPALMQQVCGYRAAAMLLCCVDLQRNIDLANAIGERYDYDPAWALLTGVHDVGLLVQTAVIAARACGLDYLVTNGTQRGDPQRIWQLVGLPNQHCFPVTALLLGRAATPPPAQPSGRLGDGGTIHRGRYQRRDPQVLLTTHRDPAYRMWEPREFFTGPARRAATVYGGVRPALAQAGFAIRAGGDHAGA
jgi:nitroreductase